ncbi:MAG: hypothetical protein AB8G05_02560 [Oligoflexales bacterium]
MLKRYAKLKLAIIVNLICISAANADDDHLSQAHFKNRINNLLETNEVRSAQELLSKYKDSIFLLNPQCQTYSESSNLTKIRISVGFPDLLVVPAPKIYELFEETLNYKKDIDAVLTTLDRKQYDITTRHYQDLARISVEIHLKLSKLEKEWLDNLKKNAPRRERKASSLFYQQMEGY